MWWIGGGVIGFVVFVAVLVALVDVVRNRDKLTRAQFFSYLILILILPLLGAGLYAVFGRQAVRAASAA